jgi:hypothetical protein
MAVHTSAVITYCGYSGLSSLFCMSGNRSDMNNFPAFETMVED